MQDFKMNEVITDADIKQVASLAAPIWREHFTPIIGAEQVEYMLDRFQSAPAIVRQIRREGYRYLLLTCGGQTVGYTGFHLEESKLFLSKLYIAKAYRGNRYASRVMEYLVSLCRENGRAAIYLTVNKHNDATIAIYQKLGFQKVREQKADIGNGFYMDDDIMELTV